MQEICARELCTGCFACYSACPAAAIEIGCDKQGFYVPRIDIKRCADCGQCRSVCPALQSHQEKTSVKGVFACWHKDDGIRAASSSGGIFSQLSSMVLAENGVVFGAAFAGDWSVRHDYVETLPDLKKLRASKYVQSLTGDSFQAAQRFLTDGRAVLFSGTPCQIAGLKSFLKDIDSTRLLLVDLVCKGVPSPLIYRAYLDFLQQTQGARLTSFNFRQKPNGWKKFGIYAAFANGSSYFQDFTHDPYLVGFLKNYFLNQPCYNCAYANIKRPGDLTIADFWGYKAEDEKFADDDKGITLLLINSAKGQEFFRQAQPHIISTVKNLPEAVAGNAALERSSFCNKRYNEFWQDQAVKPFAQLAAEYFAPKNK